jgi:hypothetical protein
MKPKIEDTLSILKIKFQDQPIRFGIELTKEFDQAFYQNDFDYISSLLESIPSLQLSDDALVGLLANIKTSCLKFNCQCAEDYYSLATHAISKIKESNWSAEDIEDAKNLLL